MSVRIDGSTGIDTIQDNTVTSAKIVTDTITNADLKTGDAYKMVTMTPQNSTSGTSIDFTGIPAWAKRITVMFNGVSTSGISIILIQLGDSGGVENTGYSSTCALTNTTAIGNTSFSTGVGIETAAGAAAVAVRHGQIILNLLDISSNLWVGTGIVGYTNVAQNSFFSGTKALSATLDRIHITTVNGTDTFDAGSINVMYEG